MGEGSCMVPSHRLGVTVIIVFSGLWWAAAAGAQQTSAITGVVKDISGAVLPGVTVEASSPALIEKTRTATTDGEGRYNIVDLQPGTYTVTFTLAGFGTFKRDGIALSSGFTATVDAQLTVGALEESVTVGGGQYTAEAGAYHGKRGTKVSFNGMGVENSSGNSSYQVNAATVDQMVLQTSGISAEVNADGPVMNVVPKQGGNTFQAIFNGLFSNHSMESDNLTSDLRSRGLDAANKRVKIFDEAASLGGPIKKDSVWFFGAFRTWG